MRTIILNARPVDVEGPTISYEQVAALADQGPRPRVSFKLARGMGGSLGPGDRIAVSEGLVLTATQAEPGPR